ncbi:MAG: hypothetical protein IKK39_00780 [Thermoguttaceae bacterium]|nr:hypothetical protein [Thermoguttaceae bacterium]
MLSLASIFFANLRVGYGYIRLKLYVTTVLLFYWQIVNKTFDLRLGDFLRLFLILYFDIPNTKQNFHLNITVIIRPRYLL